MADTHCCQRWDSVTTTAEEHFWNHTQVFICALLTKLASQSSTVAALTPPTVPKLFLLVTPLLQLHPPPHFGSHFAACYPKPSCPFLFHTLPFWSFLRPAHLEGLWEVLDCEAYVLHNQHPLTWIYHNNSQGNSTSPRYLCAYTPPNLVTAIPQKYMSSRFLRSHLHLVSQGFCIHFTGLEC